MSERYKDKDWLQEQVDKGLTQKKIAEKCETNQPVISYWVNQYNIIPISIEDRGWESNRSEEEKNKVCELYKKDKLSGTQIAKKFDFSYVTVYKILKENNIDTVMQGEGYYNVDESAFSTLTPESKYWIGFIMADGCVETKGHTKKVLSVTLALSEINHLKRLKDFLSAGHKINKSNKHNSCKLSISSDKIAKDLEKYGITPRKTFTAKVKKLSDDKHFWRGVVDGDGSMGVYNEGYLEISLYGSEDILKQFTQFINTTYDKWKGTYHQHKNIYRVSLKGTVARKVGEKLYNNSNVALERKKNIVINHLRKKKRN